MSLRIFNTINLLVRCWEVAERELCNQVDELSPGAEEEMVTAFFSQKLAAELLAANRADAFASAFLEDLRYNFPRLRGLSVLRKISGGLIADVTWHNRTTEKLTGGDFGLVIASPIVSDAGSHLNIGGSQRGLLVQAKLKNGLGEWRGFSKQQKKVLPQCFGFLAILLYEYNDPLRRALHSFQWQNCAGYSMEEAMTWMKTGVYPNRQASGDVIRDLGNGSIGTDSHNEIATLIAPERNRGLEIRIDWPDGRGPDAHVYVHSAVQSVQRTLER